MDTYCLDLPSQDLSIMDKIPTRNSVCLWTAMEK